MKCSLALLGAAFVFAVACGEKDEDKKLASPNPQSDDAVGYSDKLLTDFLSYTPVIEGDVAFVSKGHGGALVRSFLNPEAANHLRTQSSPYPLVEGSVFAKAVVADAATPASQANTVYFMRKEKAGFDPEHGDWSYAIAKRVDGKLKFDPNLSQKAEVCISCHVKFKDFDYVQTSDFFLKQSTGG